MSKHPRHINVDGPGTGKHDEKMLPRKKNPRLRPIQNEQGGGCLIALAFAFMLLIAGCLA